MVFNGNNSLMETSAVAMYKSIFYDLTCHNLILISAKMKYIKENNHLRNE